MITLSVVNMAEYLNARMSTITERIRTTADTTKVTATQNAIRSRCINVTMSMLRKMYVISDTTTYSDVSRGMLAVANSAPIKCVCVGISPYENGILPPFATSLAYSPRTCIGCTPSVQVLSQIMSLCASRIEFRNAKLLGIENATTIKTTDEYATKFAMMLRCSYACVEAGVAFVNCSPVVTSTVSKTCLSMSLFSEWIANVVMIHIQHSFRITIISMGMVAENAISDAVGSYPIMNPSMNLIRVANPAALPRMSVTKTKMGTPINNSITNGESILDAIVGRDPFPSVRTGYDWNSYEITTLDKFMKSNEIKPVVELLADHEPDRLLNQFVNSVEGLFVTMSEYDVEAMMQSMSVNENANASASTNEIHSETVPVNTPTNDSSVMNPFENVNSSIDNNSGAGMNDNSNTDANQGRTQSKSDGPYMFPKRSQLGQLLDPTGKGVSQQVIIIDSINLRCNEILIANKELNENMRTIAERQVHLMDVMNKFGIIDRETKEDASEFLTTFTSFCEDVMEKMETSKGVIEAMPAVIEGDRGIYEHETMPVAPLLRRDDGSTMRQYVYGPAMKSAESSEEVNSNTVDNSNANAINPFNPNPSASETESVSAKTSSSLIETGNTMYNTHASRIITTSMNSFDFGNGASDANALNALKSYKAVIENTVSNLFQVMVTIVSQHMFMNDGADPDEYVIDNMIGCLGSMSSADLESSANFFVDAVMSDTSVANLFELLATTADDNNSDTTTTGSNA